MTHGTAETDVVTGSLLIHIAPATRVQPIGPVFPGSSFIYPGFIIDQGGDFPFSVVVILVKLK